MTDGVVDAGSVRGAAGRLPHRSGVLGAQAGGPGHPPRHQADPHAAHPSLKGDAVI